VSPIRSAPKAREIARNLAKGNRVDTMLSMYPEIARAYDIYTDCRGTQLVVYQTSKAGKEMQVMASYPTGYDHLPYEGGVMDQPYRLMEFFGEFMNGERRAFFSS
jgi:hypothetical protein